MLRPSVRRGGVGAVEECRDLGVQSLRQVVGDLGSSGKREDLEVASSVVSLGFNSFDLNVRDVEISKGSSYM